MTEIDDKIQAAKAVLRELYAEKKAQKPAAQKRPTEDEQKLFAIESLKNGKTLKEIATLRNRKLQTVQYWIWSWMYWEAHERLLSAGRASVVRPNEYGGESWDVDHRELERMMLDINSEFGNPLSEAKLTL